MTETAELTKTEYRQRVTELAKDAIREHCVDEAGRVEYRSYAASEAVDHYGDSCDLLTDHPLSIEQHGSGSFTVDDAEAMASASPTDAIERARARLLEGDVDDRIQDLLDGEWDAIETTERTRTVTESHTRLREPGTTE